ncbi:MAG: hypothetical protein PUK72_03060 [Oscillospiraceae bacterium]|nr:hypothetical protein [Oscillospiraceae bacterium]
MFIALTKAANAYAVRLSAIFHHEAKMLGFKGHFCEAVNIAKHTGTCAKRRKPQSLTQ